MADSRPISIPVILGTARKGRMSAHAARFVLGELQKRDGVVTELIDVGTLSHRLDDNGQDTADPAFSACMNRADAIVLVAPEYNHAMPEERSLHQVFGQVTHDRRESSGPCRHRPLNQ